MLNLLQILLIGHVHKWKIITEEPLIDMGFDGRSGKVGMAYICQCEKCGKIRRRDLD